MALATNLGRHYSSDHYLETYLSTHTEHVRTFRTEVTRLSRKNLEGLPLGHLGNKESTKLILKDLISVSVGYFERISGGIIPENCLPTIMAIAMSTFNSGFKEKQNTLKAEYQKNT